MASEHLSEPWVVDGMVVTDADDLPPEASDLTNYRPLRAPVTLYRRFGRVPVGAAVARDVQAASDDDVGGAFAEGVRRQLAKRGHPAGSVGQLRCEAQHPLLWLVPSPWGLVPITRTSAELDDAGDGPLTTWALSGGPVVRKSADRAARRFVSHFHGEDVELGRPRTLKEWPEDRPLPPASCACYAEVGLTVADARRCRASARRSAVYRRSDG